ncbi:MAG: hypothetical protein ACRCVV_10400 [Shewanella sp.]
MTIIAFDGKHLVADGKRSYNDKDIPEYMDDDDVIKIKVLSKPWKFSPTLNITAIASAGVSDDITMVIAEINRSIESGETCHAFRKRFYTTFKQKFNCDIVGVGLEVDSDGNKTATSLSIYLGSSGNKTSLYQEWNGPIKMCHYVTAGTSYQLPSRMKIGDVFKSSVEVVSYVCAISPRGCGGRLTRYNPLTGKLDHPNPTAVNRMLVINKKLMEVRIRTMTLKHNSYGEIIGKLTSLGE